MQVIISTRTIPEWPRTRDLVMTLDGVAAVDAVAALLKFKHDFREDVRLIYVRPPRQPLEAESLTSLESHCVAIAFGEGEVGEGGSFGASICYVASGYAARACADTKLIRMAATDSDLVFGRKVAWQP